jgi:predicted aspartyl protease
MVTVKEPRQMGRFSVEVELVNYRDLILAEAGHLPADQVRRMRLRGVVDSGAAMLVLPESAARQLGLETRGGVTVRYADGRSAQRQIAAQLQLSYAGRSGVFEAIVEPGRDSALIGAIVLEALDLVVDCRQQRLEPRDPNSIIAEIE